MSAPQTLPYGSWKSPIHAGQIASAMVGLSGILVDGQDVYWTELRPCEAGRCVLVKRDSDGTLADVIPQGYSVRARVHEYGGRSCVVVSGTVYFTNFSDQRLYRYHPGVDAEPVPLTPSGHRYADGVWDARRKRIICVHEDHTAGCKNAHGNDEPLNNIVAIDPLEGGVGQVLVQGHDFYAAPRLSPDGRILAWLAWNDPHMPWDAAELCVAGLRDDGTMEEPSHLAGGADGSVVQPQWAADNSLYFVWEEAGWWNLYRIRFQEVNGDPCARADGGGVLTMNAEFALPLWTLGQKTYDFINPDIVLCSCQMGSMSQLMWINASSHLVARVGDVPLPYTHISEVCVNGGKAYLLAGSPSHPTAVVCLDLKTSQTTVLRSSSEMQIDAGYLSTPEPVEFPTEGGRTAHGLFYRPANKDFMGPEGEKPPLLVKIHGGPTSATTTTLRMDIQYYTSRGFAVLDVNYGGSTGYGREYRSRLYGQWGIVDVDDCCNGAKHLARQGHADEKRLAITGGSAGGFTTLACAAFRDVFAAGSSHFGVSDCEMLHKETHKFESHYLETLIGPYPQRRDLYVERSPLRNMDGISCPLIFFQGLADPIVPPNQTEMMFNALKNKGLPTAYVPFEGEHHGFRKAAHIQRALEGEFYFFSKVFGFAPADEIEPVKIENL